MLWMHWFHFKFLGYINEKNIVFYSFHNIYVILSYWIGKVKALTRKRNIYIVFCFWINNYLYCWRSRIILGISFDSLSDRLVYNMFKEQYTVCSQDSWECWINIHHIKTGNAYSILPIIKGACILNSSSYD